MNYILKHVDTPLMKFRLTSDALAGLSAEILEIDPNYRSRLPLDLEPTDSGLLKWLKRRIIPRNRAFVQQFLAKLGLNVNDIKGIIDLCISKCKYIS